MMKANSFRYCIILILVLPTIVHAQEVTGDSLQINSTVPLSEEVRDITEQQPGVDERILEYELDQHRLPQPAPGRPKIRMDGRQLKGIITYPNEALEKQKAFMGTKGLNPEDLFEGSLLPLREAIRAINVDYQEMQPIRQFDSRFEIGNLTLATAENQRIITNSFSVLGIVASSQLRKTPDGFEAVNLLSLRNQFNLCPEEPYGDQPLLCSGTAFLVAPDVVLTARHNLDQIAWQKMALVIGYKVLVESGKANLNFATKDVYHAQSVIRSHTLDQLDLVLLKLNRAVEGAAPLSIEAGYQAPLKESVYSLGHPVGLPMKYITNATIKSVESAFSFYTSLDTFKGNSGSPVFSRNTHNVIGVLVEGGTDFNSNGPCTVSHVCADINCLGERVVNIGPLAIHIMNLISKSQ